MANGVRASNTFLHKIIAYALPVRRGVGVQNMTNIKALFSLLLYSCLIVLQSTNAEVLASFKMSSFTAGQSNDHIKVFISIDPNFTMETPKEGLIFETSIFDECDIGKTFHINKEMDSDFINFSHHFTNGDEDYLTFHTSSLGSTTSHKSKEESFLIGSSVFCKNDIDLEGYIVQSMDFTLDSLTLNFPVDHGTLGSPAYVYFHDWKGTFSINGSAIPEPNSVVLVIFGVGLIILKGKKLHPKA